MRLCTSLVGIVWGSKHTFSGLRIRYAVLPTKTSLWFNFGGSPLSFSRACSQVFTTSVVNPSFLLTLVAVILLIVSLSLITRSHLPLISSSECSFAWVTLSHLSTQIRYADSEMMICKSRVGPLRTPLPFCLLFSLCLWVDHRDMQPLPRMVPRLMFSQGMLLYDQLGMLLGLVFASDVVSVSCCFLGVLFYVCCIGASWGSK